jgi:hypothetical protein
MAHPMDVLPLDSTRYFPVQRHVNNVPNFLFNLPLNLRSAASWPSIGARNGSINIREGNAYLVNLTGEIESSSVGNTLGVCSGTAITTSGLGAADALTTDRTGCGPPKPLLFRGQSGCRVLHVRGMVLPANSPCATNADSRTIS